MVKLDRILINGEWEEVMPNYMLQALSSKISDHCPLLLNCEIAFKLNRSFRFQNHRLQLECFEETVRNAWNRAPTSGDPIATFAGKLDATAKGLRRWQAQFCNDIKLKAAITSDLIGQMDKAMDVRSLTTEERQFRALLKVQRLGYAALDRAIWRQKSSVQGIKEGDAGGRFFKNKASARRRKNYIIRLMVDGVIITDQDAKVKAMHNFFEPIFGVKESRKRRLNLAMLGYERIDMTDMDEPIIEEEILANIKELDGNRAPGPDGFTGFFYQRCWPIIKTDLVAAVRAVQQDSTANLHRLNQATMVLLPKTPEDIHAKDFRPISLVCSFAKLVTKILATRLQRRMKDLIRPCQNAFIKGRAIQDNFCYVNGMAKAFRKSKTPALMLKIDIQRAFDTVSWEFLLELLVARGFGRKFTNCLAALLRSASTKVLVNGELSERISLQRGLRQGDPLSPLLFVLVMDCLAALFDKAVHHYHITLLLNTLLQILSFQVWLN